ncbi:hypothetical protein AMTRI_Chr13g117780 [Amborella trichopoda]
MPHLKWRQPPFRSKTLKRSPSAPIAVRENLLPLIFVFFILIPATSSSPKKLDATDCTACTSCNNPCNMPPPPPPPKSPSKIYCPPPPTPPSYNYFPGPPGNIYPIVMPSGVGRNLVFRWPEFGVVLVSVVLALARW